MMATPANKEILQDAHLLAPEGFAAAGGDLVIAIRADSEEAAREALAPGGSAPGRAGEDGKRRAGQLASAQS